jgi:hypothetical protein
MDITSLSLLGASSVQSTNLLALMGSTGTGDDSSGDSALQGIQSDSLDISAAGWSAANAQGGGGLQVDINNLGSLISSGDLTGAQKLLTQIQERMQAATAASADATGSSSSTTDASSAATSASSSTSATASASSTGADTISADLSALATALSSGSTASAQSAFKTLQSDLGSVGSSQGAPPPPPPSGSNPLQQDMTKLGELIDSGDTSDAQTLLAKIQDHLQNGPGSASASGTSATTSSSASSSTSSTSSSSGTSTTSTISSDLAALASALDGSGTTSAKTAWQTLQSDLAGLSQASTSGSGAGTSSNSWLLAAYL